MLAEGLEWCDFGVGYMIQGIFFMQMQVAISENSF